MGPCTGRHVTGELIAVAAVAFVVDRHDRSRRNVSPPLVFDDDALRLCRLFHGEPPRLVPRVAVATRRRSSPGTRVRATTTTSSTGRVGRTRVAPRGSLVDLHLWEREAFDRGRVVAHLDEGRVDRLGRERRRRVHEQVRERDRRQEERRGRDERSRAVQEFEERQVRQRLVHRVVRVVFLLVVGVEAWRCQFSWIVARESSELTFGFRGTEPRPSYPELDEAWTLFEHVRETSFRQERRPPQCKLFQVARVAEDLEEVRIRDAVHVTVAMMDNTVSSRDDRLGWHTETLT